MGVGSVLVGPGCSDLSFPTGTLARPTGYCWRPCLSSSSSWASLATLYSSLSTSG